MNAPAESVLVLGSAGFIGSALCSHLARLGHPVLAFGRSEIAICFAMRWANAGASFMRRR